MFAGSASAILAKRPSAIGLAIFAILFGWLVPSAPAAFVGTYSLSAFTLITNDSDGLANVLGGGLSLMLTGGNTGSGNPGSTVLTTSSRGAGIVRFDYLYNSTDGPEWDSAWYVLGDDLFPLADLDGSSGTLFFPVELGQRFGWGVLSEDNLGEAGILTISAFDAPGSSGAVPEPGTLLLLLGSLCAVALARRRASPARGRAFLRLCALAAMIPCVPPFLFAQGQTYYAGGSVTGQLVLVRTVNPLATAAQTLRMMGAAPRVAEVPRDPGPLLRPPRLPLGKTQLPGLLQPLLGSGPLGALTESVDAMAGSEGLPVAFASALFGFNGLTHLDQRLANNGRQFSVEPPNPSIAAGNGYVLAGVNNAIQVYNQSGAPLLPRVLASNELFGVQAAIDWSTGINGVYPTDMRVFFDHSVNRWFVLQRAQGYDVSGAPLNNSRLYLAVSQTADPVGIYNIYEMDTTNGSSAGCPCIADYPQIGADQYGFYISVNEFNTFAISFVDAVIFAISKSALASGAAAPPIHRFRLPYTTGYEFAIQPASTPPGGSYFLSSGGLEYFTSTQASSPAFDSGVAVWAMYNTASLNSAGPNPMLTRVVVPVLGYRMPSPATQRNGFLAYGSTLIPPGALAYLDGGDNRVQALSYAGGRLHTTFPTQVAGVNATGLVGGAYVVLSPTFRNGVLAARVLNQHYLQAPNNHILRPAVAVNALGNGAIAFTLAGPDYFPSAAYLPVNGLAPGASIAIAALGAAPEDGFTGYPGGFSVGMARWGDYSTAVAANDGTIWMVAQYIPNAPRTEYANWGTFLFRHLP